MYSVIYGNVPDSPSVETLRYRLNRDTELLKKYPEEQHPAQHEFLQRRITRHKADLLKALNEKLNGLHIHLRSYPMSRCAQQSIADCKQEIFELGGIIQ